MPTYDKNFKGLIDEVKKTNLILENQNEGQENKLDALATAQNKTAGEIEKGNSEQEISAKKQLALDKISAEEEKKANKALIDAEKRKEFVQKLKSRALSLAKKAPSALLNSARSVVDNALMRKLGSAASKVASATKKGFFTILKRLIQGGLVLAGIVALDKFINSKYFPMMIKFLKEDLIPGIKKFATYLITDFSGDLKTLLVGEKGEWNKPTGGIFGTIQSIFRFINNGICLAQDLFTKDNTGGKFRTTVSSFFSLIGAIFDFNKREDGTYFSNIKEKFGVFATDLFCLFEGFARVVGELLGYTTKNENFFAGVKEDLIAFTVSEFKKLVGFLGEAFAAAFPGIAKVLNIKSSQHKALEKFEKDNIIRDSSGLLSPEKKMEKLKLLKAIPYNRTGEQNAEIMSLTKELLGNRVDAGLTLKELAKGTLYNIFNKGIVSEVEGELIKKQLKNTPGLNVAGIKFLTSKIGDAFNLAKENTPSLREQEPSFLKIRGDKPTGNILDSSSDIYSRAEITKAINDKVLRQLAKKKQKELDFNETMDNIGATNIITQNTFNKAGDFSNKLEFTSSADGFLNNLSTAH